MSEAIALVTGADGFIGSHLTEYLIREGYSVRALVQYNSFNSWGWLDSIDGIRNKCEIIAGDVRDPAFCRHVTKNVDVIYHLAALIAIPFSYHAPSSYIETNVTGTLNICQAALDNGVARVLHTSTSEVYGTAQYVPIDEKHPLQPQSPYSASKIGADSIAHSFYTSFDLPLTIVRPFNTFGPRQSARAVIPSTILQLLDRDEIEIGDMTPTRDFNYVADTCRGFELLANCDEAAGESVNIATNSEISVADTVATIASLMGKSVKTKQTEERMRPEKSEVFRLFGDNSKILELTGYQPSLTFEQALQETILWYSDVDNLSQFKGDIYNL